MRTDNFTHTAADAFINIKLQGSHIFQVSEILHFFLISLIAQIYLKDHFPKFTQFKNGAATQAITAAPTAMTWTGMPWRISFSTPDGEVYGVAPVKFMAA
jgi:hypothetical protein